ncbi:MAG: GGDEF domain-containing protein [Candidatus Adiutrix sp.]|jgi:diguanylate cyclase (GGDEF)-like protein|nr:GGDEF domain-containing protein [Candidatus Adiutrix sp.]
MKRTLALIVTAWLAVFSVGMAAAQGSSGPEAAPAYQKIPGVTVEEIAAIEAMRAEGRAFTCGFLDSTEAFVQNDGRLDGFSVLLTGLLSDLFDLRFTATRYHRFDLLLADLETGELNFSGELTPTAVRRGTKDEWFEVGDHVERGKGYFMSTPTAGRRLRIFTLAGSPARDETNLTGLKIGFLEGTSTPSDIRQAYHLNFEAVDVAMPENAGPDYGSYDLAVAMLKSGEIDAFIGEGTADHAFSKFNLTGETIRSAVIFPMLHIPVSLSTADPELKAVISVLDKFMAKDGVDALYALYSEGELRYAKNKWYNALNVEELAYLNELRYLRKSIAVESEHDNYPVSFYNETNGRFEGIALDVLDHISRLTGIPFEIVSTKDDVWEDMFNRVKSGQSPMVAQLLKSQARSRDFIWSDAPYSRSYYALLSKLDYPNLSSYLVRRASVGVMQASGHQDIYQESFPDNNNLVEYGTFNDTLDALERGEVELVMGSEHMLLNQINYREKSGLKINLKLGASMDSYFGFNKHETILRSIISKAQQSVPIEIIETNWTSRSFDYSSKMAAERTRSMAVFIIILSVVLMGTVAVLINNIKLGRYLKKIANSDALTGIYNKRFFMKLAEIQQSRSLRTQSDCFIIIFDLDHFKIVNDTYGHVAGDKVLQEVAQRVKNSIRPYDIFGRYGGEEFMLLITDVKPITKENVIASVERIRQEICRAPVEFDGKDIFVSASFGIAYAFPRNDMNAAIEYADKALYRAKNAGRNRTVFFTG